MNKISWDSNAIFIIFCNFWVPRITVHSFRTFLTVPPPTLYKVKTRKKFWINAANVVRGVKGSGKVLGIGGDWKTPHKCKSVPRLLSMIAVLLCTVFDMSRPVNQKVSCIFYSHKMCLLALLVLLKTLMTNFTAVSNS